MSSWPERRGHEVLVAIAPDGSVQHAETDGVDVLVVNMASLHAGAAAPRLSPRLQQAVTAKLPEIARCLERYRATFACPHCAAEFWNPQTLTDVSEAGARAACPNCGRDLRPLAVPRPTIFFATIKLASPVDAGALGQKAVLYEYVMAEAEHQVEQTVRQWCASHGMQVERVREIAEARVQDPRWYGKAEQIIGYRPPR